jgi:PleD family two-component response regulator
VLVDLRMPEIDGFEVTRRLRADPDTEYIPVIVLSSEEDPDIKAKAFAVGANDYLVKWPDPRELVARVRYHSDACIARRQRDAPSCRCATARSNWPPASWRCTRRKRWKRSAS